MGEFGQHARVDGVGHGPAQHRHREGVEGAHTATQPAGQDLFQFGEGPDGGLTDALDALAGGRTQSDRHGHGLVVVQEQRRQLGARAQLVATARARAGVDRVAESAEPVDVPAQGAGADAEPLGQVGAGPLAVGLEQGQQTQQACRGLQHGASLPALADSRCPQGSYANWGTSKQVRFMSPCATQPSPSRQRATDRQVRLVSGGSGSRSNLTGRSSPPAVYPSLRFM